MDSIKIKNLFIEEFYESNLLILNKEKIDKILRENELIEYIEFRKIYPSKLVVKIFEKKTIAIINYKQNKFFLTITSGVSVKIILFLHFLRASLNPFA